MSSRISDRSDSSQFCILLGLVLIGMSTANHAQADLKGSGDVAWVGRYDGSRILLFLERQFDAAEFLTRTPASANPVGDLSVEGQRTRIVYQAPANR